MTAASSSVRAAELTELQDKGRLIVNVNGHSVLLIIENGAIHALDNRCPHMGFPLHRGSVRDGILTCHWHHARFDLSSGGTFDPWADDVRRYPTEVRNGDIFIDLAPRRDERAHQLTRVEEGLQHNISLVIAKSCVSLLSLGEYPAQPFRIGLDFGTRYRRAGFGQGLTILTCMANLLPRLDATDRAIALYHGLDAVASDTAGMAARFPVRALPDSTGDLATLKRWFRRFVEVRDQEGAERCIHSALEAGAGPQEMADMLFASATDHRYITIGHVLDFTNKALEALDIAGWDHAPQVLSSLAPAFATATRMEESNAWRNPIDLVDILESAFERIPDALASTSSPESSWNDELRRDLVDHLLGDEPQQTVDALLDSLRKGAPIHEVAQTVAYAAALRIARFHLSNEFSDWDTALHTFTFANAVHQGIRRAPTPELARGILDAAMSVYLDRFLNVPATRLPEGDPDYSNPNATLEELEDLLDRQRQVNEAARLVANYLAAGGDPEQLQRVIGVLLLREDRDFHTIQAVEGAFRQFQYVRDRAEGSHLLIAAVRYLAAHAPTPRAEGQTFDIATRLHRGERLYEDAAS